MNVVITEPSPAPHGAPSEVPTPVTSPSTASSSSSPATHLPVTGPSHVIPTLLLALTVLLLGVVIVTFGRRVRARHEH
jgi:LPXTG-motif cell wall-anchored protein